MKMYVLLILMTIIVGCAPKVNHSFVLEVPITYEEEKKGMITIRRANRHYYEDGVDFIDYTHDEPLTRWGVKK